MNFTIFLIIGLLCIIASIATSLYLYSNLKSIKKVGSIVINTTDPNKDIYSLELNVPFGELDLHNKVMFEIKHE